MITVKCIAAYDFGTSGVKAALVSEEGKILAVQEKAYPLYKPQPLYVEQDLSLIHISEPTRRS